MGEAAQITGLTLQSVYTQVSVIFEASFELFLSGWNMLKI